MVLLEDFYAIDKMFEYTFSSNRYFIEYTEPFILLGLIEKARNDWVILLLLMIAMVKCARGRTNVLFGFLLDYRGLGEDDVERFKSIQETTVWLWNLLNHSDTYIRFRQSLIQIQLYMNNYDVIYQEIDDDYCKYEKNRVDSRVEHFFNEKQEGEK